VFVVLLLLDVCSRFEIASPTGYKKGTQKNYFYNRPFFGPLLNERWIYFSFKNLQ
jgi:hypothetical protein